MKRYICRNASYIYMMTNDKFVSVFTRHCEYISQIRDLDKNVSIHFSAQTEHLV